MDSCTGVLLWLSLRELNLNILVNTIRVTEVLACFHSLDLISIL